MHRPLNKLPITSITPFTFQDYPDHTACILWFSGCNMACRYCHNPELATGGLPKLTFAAVQEFLLSRQGLLDGVVLSGGECTCSVQLPAFTAYLQALGYQVKIDTNGTNPAMVQALLADNLIDYVALDYKAPAELFEAITGLDGHPLLQRSLRLLIDSGIAFEIRTTVHTDLLQEDHINRILQHLRELGFTGTYYLQNFGGEKTLGGLAPPSRAFDFSRLEKNGITVATRGFANTHAVRH